MNAKGIDIIKALAPAAAVFSAFRRRAFCWRCCSRSGYLLPVPSDYSGFDAYREVLFDAWFWKSFLFSVHVGFASALLAVTAGTVLAYLISRLPRVMQTYANVYKIPLILPHIAVAFVTMLFLGKSGVIASVCYQFGIIETMQDFPTLIFSPTGFGVIAAYTYKGAAFAMLLVLAILRKLDERILDTARMLGASGTTIFFRIVLPFLRPVIQTTFLILFLYNFGAFEIPYLLGESHPGMLSVQVFNLYFMRELTERPLGHGHAGRHVRLRGGVHRALCEAGRKAGCEAA